MAILEIIEAPHPVLSAKARKVNDSEFGADMYRFLQDMAETMYAAPGVGLAAPQVGDGRRIIVADPGNDDEQAERRLYMMVNPTIIEKSKKTIRYEESCLSVPEYSVMVKRHKRIKVAWQDAFGNPQSEWFEDFPAIVLQHEIDHLLGLTLLEHSSRFKRNRYLTKKRRSKKGRL